MNKFNLRCGGIIAASACGRNPAWQSLLLLLLAEDREVHIALGMSLEVIDQTIGALHGMVEAVVQRGVLHEQSQRTLLALHLCHHAVDIAYGAVHTVHSALQIDFVEVVGECCYILSSLGEGACHGGRGGG